MNLSNESCIACRKGERALSGVEALMLLKELPKWKMGALAETENHHPDIAFGWGYAEVTFTTHATGGLHRNDFIMAAKVDNLT
jgi:hypothetical protein